MQAKKIEKKAPPDGGANKHGKYDKQIIITLRSSPQLELDMSLRHSSAAKCQLQFFLSWKSFATF